MNRLALIAGLIGVLVAPGAQAAPAEVGSWLMGGQTGRATKTLRGGQWATYTPASGADDESASPILSVMQCENYDLYLADDYDGDGTACTVTWEVQSCPPGASGLATDALKNASCAVAEGVTDLTGDSQRSDLAGFYVRIHGQNAGANINSCRITIKCAQDGVVP